MRSVAVTGVAGPIGQRLLPRLEEAGVQRVVGIDHRAWPVRTSGLEVVALDVATADLGSALDGVDTVVHLAWFPYPRRDPGAQSERNIAATRRVLAAASTAAVSAVVCLSSATVYGAWPDNPVPLTEDAPLRPNPGIGDAVHHAEAERLAADWAADHRAASVAVMRPVAVVGPGVDGWMAGVIGGGPRVRGGDPPRQFLHADDLATALTLAVSSRLDGTFNVTPDGWVAGDVVRDLAARGPHLPLPGRLAPAAAAWAWRLRVSEVPPSWLPLLEHPWVVANDRLRAAGWRPRFTSEEALVSGRPGSQWREMSPQRRQEVALTAAGLAVAGIGTGVAALVKRSRVRR